MVLAAVVVAVVIHHGHKILSHAGDAKLGLQSRNLGAVQNRCYTQEPPLSVSKA